MVNEKTFGSSTSITDLPTLLVHVLYCLVPCLLLEVVEVEGNEVAVQNQQMLLIEGGFHLADEIVLCGQPLDY